MSDIGNSNRITRAYLDSLLIETRYMDAEVPETDLELYGQQLPFPIMTAALSHLDHFMFPGAADALAQGAVEAGAALMYGMAHVSDGRPGLYLLYPRLHALSCRIHQSSFLFTDLPDEKHPGGIRKPSVQIGRDINVYDISLL